MSIDGASSGHELAGIGGTDLIQRRHVLAGLTATMLWQVPLAAGTRPFDAVVGAAPQLPPTVPRFGLLDALLQSDLAAGSAPLNVLVGPGDHVGQVVIRRPNLRLTGSGVARTTFRAGAYAGAIAPDGKPFGTFRTAVLEVAAPGFEVRDLTILNSFDAPAEMRKPDGLKADEGGSQQAIALALRRGSDRAILERCAIVSHQDTLFCEDDRSLFRECRIAGSYDFIFGGGAARFERCEIVSRRRWEPVEGYIAAPSTMIDRPAGLVFDGCQLTAEPGVPDGSVFLGRPWRSPAVRNGKRMNAMESVGMAAYLRCTMGRHVAPSGWTRMWYTGPDGNPRTWLEPEEARFAEYRNLGPGAKGRRRARTLTDAEVARLTRAGLFGDWRPPA
ncbi:pectinesterase [Sphingomonas insulae]|uniref:Pectinesterase family protein n=1 Tax=Sphingomonas insulae TaxID=424800 RepID=A0ABN1HZA3_9SPHN|nr:pectinesterase family protein [Sphingomonas insulae]NIJ31112.1 pectinesterase [Sphingomonas insulae]